MTRCRVLVFALPLILLGADRAGAQELRLERDVPLVWNGCPAGGDQNQKSTTMAERQEAESLAAAATQSAILGDNAAAFDYLQRASLLDPSSLEISYHLARTLEELGRTSEALVTYCRYAALDSGGPEIKDVRERIAALAAATVSSAASVAFETGITHFDARRLEEAEAAFSQAIVAAPSWTSPVYNRAVVRLALGLRDAASSDARVYVNLGGDPAQVAGLVAARAEAQPSSTNAASVLVAGLVVPGLGHFVTNRPGRGVLVLGAAGGALAAGLSVQRTKVDCLSPPVDGRCPPAQVLRERTERPYLVPAIGIAVVAGVVGALDAYRTARRRGENPTGPVRTGALDVAIGPIVALSEIQLQRHEVRVELVRIRF